VCVFPEPVAPYANTVATPPRKIVSTTFKSSSWEEEEDEDEDDEEVRLKKTSLYTCSFVEYRSKTASKVYSFAFFVELAGTGFEIRTVLRSARVSKYTLLLLLLLLFGVPSRVDDDGAVVVVLDFDEVVVVFFLFFVFVFFFFFFFSSSSSSSSSLPTLVFGTTTGRVRVATKSVEKTVMMMIQRVVVVAFSDDDDDALSRVCVYVSVVFAVFSPLVFFWSTNEKEKKTDPQKHKFNWPIFFFLPLSTSPHIPEKTCSLLLHNFLSEYTHARDNTFTREDPR
jgi:hypothetical protein